MEWDYLDEALHAASQDGQAIEGWGSKKPQPKRQTKEERDRQLAISHAKLIQHRKDLETSILNSLIKLIDFPTSKSADPDKPSKEDADGVKEHLRHFQASDFDDLIKERNIEKQCGYLLCPRPHKPFQPGKFTIVAQGRDVQILNTDDIMRWCSDECARRAMYLRVQMNEFPAWERTEETKFDLAGEKSVTESDDESKVDKQAVAQIEEDLKRLALERGNPSADIDQLMTGVKEMSLPSR